MAQLQSTNITGTLTVNGVAVGGGKDFKFCCFTSTDTFTPSSGLADSEGFVESHLVGGGGGGGGNFVNWAASYGSNCCVSVFMSPNNQNGGTAEYKQQNVQITSTDACTVTVGAGGISGSVLDCVCVSGQWSTKCQALVTACQNGGIIAGGNGGNSSFGGITAEGGQGGKTVGCVLCNSSQGPLAINRCKTSPSFKSGTSGYLGDYALSRNDYEFGNERSGSYFTNNPNPLQGGTNFLEESLIRCAAGVDCGAYGAIGCFLDQQPSTISQNQSFCSFNPNSCFNARRTFGSGAAGAGFAVRQRLTSGGAYRLFNGKGGEGGSGIVVLKWYE